MVFHQVWDHVFSTWSHVAVLRALMDSAQGATGRELARQSGMNHRACLQALTELEALSIIHRVRGGRDHFFTLNRDHVLVEQGILPLLSVERSFSRSVFTYLADRLAKRVRSLIVFGSVARKEELPSSDLDLCLVVRNENEIAAAEAAAHAIAPEVLNRFGAKLAPLVLTQKEFIRRTKRKIPPVQDIVNEGVVIGGLSMKGLVNGKA
jgi:predicted nucleotidyltransferase